MQSTWSEVTKAEPCPVCGKPDWCTRSIGGASQCMRITDAPGWTIVKQCPDGGTIYRPDDEPYASPMVTPSPEPVSSTNGRDWGALHLGHVRAITGDELTTLAGELGVTVASLQTIGAGRVDGAFTFPERDATRKVIGISRRYPDGAQRAFKGSKRGVTIPDGLDDLPDPVLIVEGASDVAACISMGIAAVGRPNNRSAKFLAELLADREVLIVAEYDRKPDGSWPGREGAITVAGRLANDWKRPVSWTLPPDDAKDAREWLRKHSPDDGPDFLSGLESQAETAQPKAKKQEREPTSSQATTLVALADGLELFHDANDAGYVSLKVAGHIETWPLRSKAFKRWLSRQFYVFEGKAAGAQATQDALVVLEGKAQFDGPCIATAVRVAQHDDAIYIDLADDRWRAVKVTPEGWAVVDNCPVKFRRGKAMLPLPEPIQGGSLDALRELVNVPDDGDFALLIGFIIQAFWPEGPYPILVVSGEQGSAKSTLCELVRKIVDPNTAPLRCESKDARDLMISAANGWCLGFDNLSRVAPWLSDAFCRLSTGGGFATRELYSDCEEMIFEAQRPVLVNGITEVAERSDLIDRRIGLCLPTIPEGKRKPLSEFWATFDRAQPRIFGALLDGLVASMRNLESARQRTDRLPRMADFALRIIASEPAMPWEPGLFLSAYAENRSDANEVALEASPVAGALRPWIIEAGSWRGTAEQLLTELSMFVGEASAKRQVWPQKANALSGQLRRIAPNLRKIGIHIEFENRESGTGARPISIMAKCDDESPVCDDQDTPPSSQKNPTDAIKNSDCDNCDNCDDEIPTLSKKPTDIVDIPDGWRPLDWASNLDRMADRCESGKPAQASIYREQAVSIRINATAVA